MEQLDINTVELREGKRRRGSERRRAGSGYGLAVCPRCGAALREADIEMPEVARQFVLPRVSPFLSNITLSHLINHELC